MSENTPNDALPVAPNPLNPQKKSRKAIKILAAVAGGGILLVGGLILLAPTVASTATVRNMVLSSVNANLNGKVTIDDWSLGWFSGTKVTGLKVFDDQNALIASIGTLETELTVGKAVTGSLDLGKTKIDGVTFTANFYPDGTLNFSKLQKVVTPANTTAGGSGVTVTKTASQPLAVKGDISITGISGTFVAVGVPDGVLNIDPSNIAIKLDGLDKPITSDVSLKFRGKSGPAGVLATRGTVLLPSGASTAVSADQTLTLSGLDLSAFAPLTAISMPGQKLDLTGIGNGTLTAKIGADGSGGVNGTLTFDDLSVGGQPLKGDTLKLGKVEIPVEASVASANSNPVVTLTRVGISSDLVRLAVGGTVPTAALKQISAGKAPGAAGDVSLAFSVPDVAALARQLPKTLALRPGIVVSSGSIAENAALKFTATDVAATSELAVAGIVGIADGRPVNLEPINLKTDVKALYANDVLADVVVNSLNFNSGFATASGSGSLKKLDLTGNADLSKLGQQVGQFIDLQKTSLAGQLQYAVKTSGDPTAGDVTANLSASGANIVVAGLNALPELRIPKFQSAVAATLKRDATTKQLSTVDVTVATIEAGPVAVAATATYVVADASVPAFDVSKLAINDMAEAQRQFGAFVPALAANKIAVQSGQLATTVKGSYVGGVLKLQEPLHSTVTNFTLTKGGTNILTNETLNIAAQGTIATTPSLNVELPTLSVTSSSGFFNMEKTGDAPLKLAVLPSGAFSGSGALKVGADLARVSTLAGAFAATPPTKQVTAGQLAGTLTFDQAATSSVKADFKLAGVTVPGLMTGENMTFVASATSPDQFATLAADADVQASFLTAGIKNASVVLSKDGKPSGTLQMLKQADITVTSNDLARLWGLKEALVPPVAGALSVTGGQLNTQLSIKSDGTNLSLTSNSIKATNLAIKQGAGQYKFAKDIDLKLAANAEIAGDPALPPVQQIRQLVITALAGSLGVADLEAAGPITVTNLAAAVPSVNGQVKLNGRLEDVTGLMESLAGQAPGSQYAYVGTFAVDQKLATDASGTAANGTVTLGDVGQRTATGITPVEKQLLISNDIKLTDNNTTATLNNVSLKAASSRAIDLVASGQIKDLAVARNITQPINVKLNYDAAALLALVKPLLAPATQTSLADLTVSGNHTLNYVVTGSYPANQPPNVAIKTLRITGGLELEKASYQGMTMTKFTVPFVLADGILKGTGDPAAPTALLNNGTVNLGLWSVSMLQPTPRLNMAPNTALLKDVGLDPFLTGKVFAKIIPIPALQDAGSGKINLTVVKADKLPLGALMNLPRDPVTGELNDGVAEFKVLGEVKPGGPLFNALGSVINTSIAATKLDGKSIKLENGVLTQDIVLGVGTGATAGLAMKGDIVMQTMAYRNFGVGVGSSLLTKFTPGLAKFLPESILIPVGGTVSQPTVQPERIVSDLFSEAGRKALLGNFTGGGGTANPATPGQPAKDPVTGALDSLFGKKKKK